MNGLHCGELVQMNSHGRTEVTTVCFVNGEACQIWEVPRFLPEEELEHNARSLYREDDSEIRQELHRRARLWQVWRSLTGNLPE